MSKKLTVGIIGMLVAVMALGLAFGPAVASAADQVKPQQAGQGLNMDPKAMADMLANPDTQQRCIELMKSPELQKAMIGMMKQPEMQAAMKQMLQKDMAFHQMMLDLVNSVDMNMDHGNTAPGSTEPMPGMDHGSHHM